MINSYGKIYNLGHAYLADLFKDPVLVEEKVDGSAFSMRKLNGELQCRSKGAPLFLDNPQMMFVEALNSARELLPLMHEGWTYRCEYLQKPRHNGLVYDRIPHKHLIIYDIDTGDQNYLSYGAKKEEADRIGLECVPIMFEGMIENVDQVLKLMDTISVLGGQKIEGMVFKNYKQYAGDGKVLMGKHVSEEFKEVQRAHWKIDNPKKGDIIDSLVDSYRTPARWNKAIQHLREAGNLTDTPKDIGPLMKEVMADIQSECEQEIKNALYAWAKKEISRRVVHGLPEWYKEKLIEKQFEENDQS